MAIEAVIERNWREIDQLVDFLTFSSEGERTAAKYGPLREKFRIVAATASAAAMRRMPGTESRSN